MIELAEQPAWPTTMRSRLRDGRLMGTDGSVWVYRSVPMGPVVDAKTPADAVAAAEPVLAALEELSAMASYTMARRSMARGGYRQVHMLLVNVPQLYEPDRDLSRDHNRGDGGAGDRSNVEYLRRWFGHTPIDRRVLLLGVRLQARVGGAGGLRAAVDSVTETLISGGTPLGDYDADFAKVAAALGRAGLTEPGLEEVRLANAWWNHGEYADTPLLVHADHLHVFGSVDAVRAADQAGVEACAGWDTAGVPQHAISFASVQDLDLPFLDVAHPASAWMSSLVAAGALVVSVRGNVEPSPITRQELRRQRKRYIDDIRERASQGKMDRAEQEEMLDQLGQVEALYATGRGTAAPTLAGTSVVAGFDGQVGDISQVISHHSPAKLSMMAYRQPGAMAETMLCSSIAANPNLHDLPAQTIACSGMVSLNLVGDLDGALVGFTERDRQPAYLSPSAASAGDGSPICVVPGQTGSGKSVLMLNLGDQFARAGRPVVIWDPKQESDHSAVVEAAGGQVYSLDRLLEADGVFDPIRFSATTDVGVELAASMLMSINPWGDAKNNMEVPLQHALAYGVQHGAGCIGQALAIAKRDLDLPAGLVERVELLASSSAQFRAIVGVNPRGDGLKAAQGMTLIKVGSAYLDLPHPGQEPASIQQKIALALVRMVVFGSAMAVAGRDGVVMLDEAWIVLSAGAAEVERLGRIARSQQVLPMLFTQRVTDALNAGLAGYISRGLILPMEDPAEARAACELFKLEPTPERMARLTAKATMGGNTAAGTTPNWRSMRALRDPDTGNVLRGAIAIYADLAGRAIPVEICLPEQFLLLASTNPADIRRRKQRQQEQQAHHAKGQAEADTDRRPDPEGALLDHIF